MLRKEDEIKVSVVIPVYNAAPFLRECLDSVINQSLREIEVLCIDDGSSDGSPEILEEYAEKDGRVKVLRQENSGAGSARNNGLEHAAGEYVLFLDGDDSLLDGSLEKLWNEAHRLRLDVLRCRALDYDNKSGVISHGVHNDLRRVPPFMFHVPLRFPAAAWLFPKVNAAPWGGICRRGFLTENAIRFNHLVCVNDRSFFWETVLKATRIAFTDVRLVRYRMNLSTSLIGGRLKHFECHFRSYELVEAMCRDLPDRCRRIILDGELLDLVNWLEQGMKTPLAEDLLARTSAFLDTIDKSPWGGNTERTRWHRRISACKPCR